MNKVTGVSKSILNRITTRENTRKIQATITEENEKSILLKVHKGGENWFPKWTIKSHYSAEREVSQIFLVDLWFLEENNLA